jgi:vacuolar-type H+-ATPase subunit I/STV1
MTDATPTQKQLFLFEHDAGRLELLIRIVYWILIGVVAAVYGFIATIFLIVQWFHILILGKRNEFLSDFAKGYLEYLVHIMSYTYIMTDRRPDIMPVPVKVYEEC